MKAQLELARPAGNPGFGRARQQRALSLVSDLSDDIFSSGWWRGLSVLVALSLWAVMLGPSIVPLPAGTPGQYDNEVIEQWQASGIGASANGARTGIRMAAGARVEPIAEAPERAVIELFVTIGREGLAAALQRAGTAPGDSIRAEGLVRGAGGHVRPGSIASLTLGRRGANGARPLQSLLVRTAFDARMKIEQGEGGLTATRLPIAVDHRPLRIRGQAAGGLYWALRSAGASSQSAAAYLKALASQIDVGEIAPGDRFDLIIANRRSAEGESLSGALLYAGLERASGERPLRLVAWRAGGKPAWVDAAADLTQARATSALAWPVNARITSGFGMRVHPILRFARMHRGIDFGAGWGTPIHAAADGQVSRAGWAGGYGRQVRITHGDGLSTSYSHMSRMVVDPGMAVRQGQLIGYVGSSGLSTGPHLHYEVLRGGTAVNPLSVRFTSAPAFDPAMADAVKARLKALLAASAGW